MFQPQPTPFATFFPAYLPLPIEDNGVMRDGLNDLNGMDGLDGLDGLDMNGLNGLDDFQVSGYCSYQQAPYLSGPVAPRGNPGPGGEGLSGAAGVPVHVGSTAPLSVSVLDNCNRQPPPPPLLRPQHQHLFPPIPIHSLARNVIQKMEQDQLLQDELAAQEAAARTWQPELEGPRLGDRTPIAALSEEYAKADPIYVAKTSALSETYSYYRPVKGDGNCGWRAIGFCYFELLIEQGSRGFVDGELLRLSQLNDYLVNEGGHDPVLIEDFLEETFQLFREISASIHDPDTALAILTTKFNGDASMGILYHLRLLASAWLKGHGDQYGAWCGNDPEQYCQAVIEPPENEIDELGISLLVEVLLKPTGFILEIVYLDRSAGTKANIHRFPDQDPGNSPVMHLLYRPGHYDILYRTLPQPPPTEIQVNRMAYEPTDFPSTPQFQDSFEVNPLSLLPGFGTVGAVSPMGQLRAPSLDYSPSPQSPWFPSPYAETSPTPSSQGLPLRRTPLPTQPHPGPPVPTSTTHDFRFSRYQYEETVDPLIWPEQPLQTNTFRNSHFNTAHFNNPNFQPEEYRPDADEATERYEKPARKRSHGRAGHHSSDDNMEYMDTREK